MADTWEDKLKQFARDLDDLETAWRDDLGETERKTIRIVAERTGLIVRLQAFVQKLGGQS